MGRRKDGFHDLESLVTAISLYDELVFSARENNRITVSCDNCEIPAERANLVWRAADLLARRSGTSRGIHCQLKKRIPVGGGLGGGSSNAATALKGLNQLWDLNWPVEKLLPLAAELGSDVPFFLGTGPAVIRGRGEQVAPVQPPWEGWLLLIIPGVNISTREVYKAWKPEVEQAVCGSAVPQGRFTAAEWMQKTFNMLESAAQRVCPKLSAWMDHAARLADRVVRLSGSGSTFFTAFDHEQEARNTAAKIGESMRMKTVIVHTS